MPHRRSRLKLKHQDLAINADVRTGKLDPEDVMERPEVIRRDGRTGSLVVRQVYDKASGDTLEEGYGFRYVNEAGEEVPREDIQLFTVEDDEEKPFTLHEPTIGSDKTLTAERWIPVATVGQYLVDRTYEIWAEEPVDIAQLYELAHHIRDFDEAPVVPFVMTASMYKNWGIITPMFFDETFALIVRVTEQKITAEHEMEPTTLEEATEASVEQTLEQPSPFEDG